MVLIGTFFLRIQTGTPYSFCRLLRFKQFLHEKGIENVYHVVLAGKLLHQQLQIEVDDLFVVFVCVLMTCKGQQTHEQGLPKVSSNSAQQGRDNTSSFSQMFS